MRRGDKDLRRIKVELEREREKKFLRFLDGKIDLTEREKERERERERERGEREKERERENRFFSPSFAKERPTAHLEI